MRLKRRAGDGPVYTRDYNELVDAINAVLNGIQQGPGVHINRMMTGELVISAPKQRLSPSQIPAPDPGDPAVNFGWFFAKITAYEVYSDSPPAWTYTFAEVHKADNLGYAGNWFVRTGGRSGTAYNLTEGRVETAVDGITGEGIDLANIGDGFDGSTPDFPDFAMVPIPVGALVVMHVAYTGGSDPEYWFQMPRSVDGACS